VRRVHVALGEVVLALGNGPKKLPLVAHTLTRLDVYQHSNRAAIPLTTDAWPEQSRGSSLRVP